MPQITVDYSERLADGFDRPAFARDLHTAVVEIAAAKPPACKTRFRRTEDPVVGPDTEGHALVHVHIGLLAKPHRRDQGPAHRDGPGTAAAVREAGRGEMLHASAEVRDLDPSYRKFEGE